MQARQAAAHFAQQSGLYDTDARMLEDASGLLGIEHIYVFNLAGKRGFVLVAGDDRVQPILGYSFSDYFDARVEGVRSLLEGYSRAIGKAISNNYETTESVRRQWDVLLDDSFEEPLFSSGGAVGPLLTTTWGQTGYYSESCPYDSPTGAHARTGDAAVALAQVLRYWQHAATGMGAHSYTDTTYPLWGGHRDAIWSQQQHRRLRLQRFECHQLSAERLLALLRIPQRYTGALPRQHDGRPMGRHAEI